MSSLSAWQPWLRKMNVQRRFRNCPPRGRRRSSAQFPAPKIEDRGSSSIFGVEERRWGVFFEDGGSSSKMGGGSAKRTPIFEEPFHLRTCRIQNPDIRAGRVGATHGGAAGRGGAGQDGTPTDRFAQETIVLRTVQGMEDNRPERFFGSTNKRNPM